MRYLLRTVALILSLLTVAGCEPAGEAAAASPEGGPVVIELFTSQGCSSCPPADRLLSKLSQDRKLAGRLIPLAFHVDYWNHIGWTDPFSAKAWSQRQQGYAKAFKSNRIYTPQLVVSGTTEVVGSNESGARRLIDQALAAEPAGKVTLAVEAPEEGRLRVKVGARLSRAASESLDLWVAVYETGLTTPIGAGENASLTLHDDYVVRRLEKALTLMGAAGSEDSAELVLGLDKRWNRSHLGVAAFLQEPRTLAIQGAAAVPLPK